MVYEMVGTTIGFVYLGRTSAEKRYHSKPGL